MTTLSRAFLSIVFIATPCLAQQLSREDRVALKKIDHIVTQQMLANQIPGVSLAVLRQGKVIHLKSYGLANVEHQVPVKPTTVFQSGSMGKQFTAAAVMVLVQENKLSLDDKLSKYFPDTPATWKDITIRNLLSHTSGLGDYPPEIDLRRDYTEGELLASFKKVPLDFEPGASWNYSNTGYVILGMLIRKITGEFYGDFIKEKIFEPLQTWQGFKTFIMRFLDTKLTIIFLANSWETRDFKFARGLASAFYPAFALPDLKTIPDPDPNTTSLVRQALMQVLRRKLALQMFTPDCHARMLGNEGQRIAQSLSAFSLPVAIIHSSELMEQKIENGRRVYRYLLTDIAGSLIVTVELTADNKVASITQTESSGSILELRHHRDRLV